MSEAINPYVLTSAGVVISILLGIVGYFLKRLVSSTDALTMLVKELEKLVNTHQTGCVEKHINISNTLKLIDVRMNTISDRVHTNTENIARIQGHLEIDGKEPEK
jgi:hypothetical protein